MAITYRYLIATTLCFIPFITQPRNSISWKQRLYLAMHERKASAIPANKLMSAQKMESYVEQCLALFKPYVTSRVFKRIEALKSDILVGARANGGVTYAGKRKFKRDIIDQYISSAILHYIKKRSYDYVFQHTAGKSRAEREDLAERISNSMRGNALAVISQNGLFDADKIAVYMKKETLDKALRQVAGVDVNAKPSPKPSQAKPTHKPTESEHPRIDFDVYPSDDCCVCMESFDNVRRVFLKPCGHDICKACAKSWFRPRGVNDTSKTCPQCRSKVDWTYFNATMA